MENCAKEGMMSCPLGFVSIITKEWLLNAFDIIINGIVRLRDGNFVG